MNSRIHIFTEFNDFHQMANGAVRSHHNDVQVFSFKDIGEHASKQTPLFKTNFYQIGLFSKVKFAVSYFGQEQVIHKKNAIILFKPGQTISFTKAEPDVSGYAIMFKEHFINYRLSNSNTLKDFSILNPSTNCVLFVDDDVFNDLIDIAEKMFREYQMVNLHRTESILQLYCQILIEKINRMNAELVTPILGSIHFKTTEDFKALVFQNIHKTKNVADYAEMLHMTEKTLINHIKQITNSTPKDFINQVITAESKAMLKNKATVDQVATYFNFTDQAHFSNFFRKMTGESPRDFKKVVK